MKMSEAEFIYNGVPTTIQCKPDDKMRLICQKFKDKAKIDQNNIFYSYDGKVGLNEELTFEQTLNAEDKKRNKMSVLVFESEFEPKEKDIIKSKIENEENNSKNNIKKINNLEQKLEAKEFIINDYKSKYEQIFKENIINKKTIKELEENNKNILKNFDIIKNE